MKKDTYIHMLNEIKSRPFLAKGIPFCNSIITKAIYIAYPCLLIYLCSNYLMKELSLDSFLSSDFLKAFFIPLICFILLSLFRKALNAPRPYEVFNAKPLIAKETQGKSFPSRHVFSIFVIATTFYVCCPLPEFGIIIFALGIALAILRVVSGVHFIKDVLAGAILGILMPAISFMLW